MARKPGKRSRKAPRGGDRSPARAARKRGGGGNSARSARGVQTSRKRRGAGKAKASRPKAPRSRSVSSRAVEIDRAARTLGDQVRPGRVRVAQTRWLTPTSRGFAAMVRQVAEAQRKTRGALYSFDLSIRFKGKDGREMRRDFQGAGVPREEDVRTRARRRGETVPQAQRRILDQRVKGAVFRVVDQETTGYKPLVVPQRSPGPADAERIRKELRRVKDRRQVRFKVTLYRLITPTARPARKKKAVRGRVRQRGPRKR